MLKIVEKHKNPEICIITPLRPKDKISKETKISVKRNKKSFVWATYKGNNNVAKNFQLGISELKKHIKLPTCAIKIDNDTKWQRNTLDHMAETLNRSAENIAYTYVSFEYQGSVNQKFNADSFDPDRLRKMNYISSNSMFKTEILERIELVTDDYYKRLLDWAYFLKLLNNGYLGIPCNKGFFVAKSSVDSISAGGKDEFLTKYTRVKEDFILGG